MGGQHQAGMAQSKIPIPAQRNVCQTGASWAQRAFRRCAGGKSIWGGGCRREVAEERQRLQRQQLEQQLSQLEVGGVWSSPNPLVPPYASEAVRKAAAETEEQWAMAGKELA